MSTQLCVWLLCLAHMLLFVPATTAAGTPVVVKNLNAKAEAQIASFQPVILALKTDDHKQAWEMIRQLRGAFLNDTSMVFVDIQPGFIVRVHARPSSSMLTKIICRYKQFVNEANEKIPGMHNNPAEHIYIPDYTLNPFAAANNNERNTLEGVGWPRAWRSLWLQFC
jgi:hypothetical protein